MQADQAIVGTVAIGMGSLALSAVAGVWDEPFRLRTILAIEDRWGKGAARLTLGIIAAGLLAAGAAILLDARPSYATQSADDAVLRSSDTRERAPLNSGRAAID